MSARLTIGADDFMGVAREVLALRVSPDDVEAIWFGSYGGRGVWLSERGWQARGAEYLREGRPERGAVLVAQGSSYVFLRALPPASTPVRGRS